MKQLAEEPNINRTIGIEEESKDSDEYRHKENFEINEKYIVTTKKEKQHWLPDNLKRTCRFTSVLFILGVILLLVGLADSLITEFSNGIPFIVLGMILIIPGGFYSYKFYSAYKEIDDDTRDEILSEIPEI